MKQKGLINHGLQCLLLFTLLMLTPLGSWAEDYPITVAGIQVTSENASNITGDGKVSFTPADNETGTPATLTLGDYDLTIDHGDAIVTDISPLKIFLAGSSTIYCLDGYAIKGTKTGENISVTFTTDETTIIEYHEFGGNLTLINGQDGCFSGVDANYENVSTIEEGYYLCIESRCRLKVGGTEVTYFNKDNILGDGTASFTPADKLTTPATPAVLTLNGATISGGIEWNKYDNLAIALNGVNSIANTQGYTIKCDTKENYDSENEPSPTLIFTKADGATSCLLTLSGYIYGFDNYYQYVTPGSGLFYIESETTATVTSTILGGGSGADEDHAIIIRNKDDFKDFISYVNNGTLTTEYVKLDADIEYTSSEEFNPIGSSDFPFVGHFDGNNKTISGILYESDDEGASVGLFESVGSEAYAGSVKKLTLSNCSFSGGLHVGAIAGELGDGTIEDCTVTSCTVRSGAAESPNVGGVVGYSVGTVTGCIVDGGQISTDLSATATSQVGGVVGYNYGGSITSCNVRNAVTITNYLDGYTGAIVGGSSASEENYSENFYTYDVTVEKQKGTDDEKIVAGYTQRGNGSGDDITSNNGIVMYTKLLTIPEEAEEGTVVPDQTFTYYRTSDNPVGYYVAPGQPVMLSAHPLGGCTVLSTSVTYGESQTVIPTLESQTDGIYIYSFDMPEADAAFNATFGMLDCEFHEGWTTYYNADIDINNLPAGVGAFVVTGLSENAAVVTQINNIPKGVPVLLNNATQTTTTNVYGTDVKSNMLKHAADAINDVSTLNGTVFGLYNGKFMRVTGAISAGKNYLYIPNATAPTGAPQLTIVFENDGNMTGISDAKRGNDNGQNDEWYTLNGQKLMQKPAVKGLYIKNGKKVVVNNK